jgi:nucleoside-diphosphate-sugar epimerase
MSQTILVTGSEGFIGRALMQALADAGLDVWGLDVAVKSGARRVAVDLLDAEATQAAVGRIPRCDVVVHLAALAHGQAPPAGETCFSVNTRTTANLLQAIAQTTPRLILFSSIAVYGEDGRRDPVRPTDALRPATAYGASKQASEEQALASALPHVEILRLAPVFTPERLYDVKKRVFLPGLPFRCRFLPPPSYSLCHLDTVVATVRERVVRGPRGRTVQNVADARPYSQHTLVDWFTGVVLPLPVGLTRPGYAALRLLPGRLGHGLRSLYWKLLCSNTYALEEVSLPPGPAPEPAEG